MKTPFCVLLLLLGFAPCAARGQIVEEENGERIQGSSSALTESTLDLGHAAGLIVEGTNDFRRKQDQSPVGVNSKLKETAQYFARYMARTDRYGHTADGDRPSLRAAEHGYEYCIVSENIAYAYRSTGFTEEMLARQFVEGWINSPEHRKNMVDPDVMETGVAVAHSEKSGNFYAVQMFGRPKTMSIRFSIANESADTIRYEIGDQVFPLPPRYTRTHERCRPSDVKLQLADAQGKKTKTKTVRPEGGDQIVVKEAGGELQVEELK